MKQEFTSIGDSLHLVMSSVHLEMRKSEKKVLMFPTVIVNLLGYYRFISNFALIREGTQYQYT